MRSRVHPGCRSLGDRRGATEPHRDPDGFGTRGDRHLATATGLTLEVFAEPGGNVTTTLTNPQESGAPLTLLVAATRADWLQVHLAQRPNGSTGWVKADAVQQHSLEYSLAASTEANTLTLLKNGQVVKTFSAATGTGGTPTPHGAFFLTELLEPTNEG